MDKVPFSEVLAEVRSNLPEEDKNIPSTQQGMFNKFNVSRVDGKDAPGGPKHGAEYFVLDLTNDPHAKAAMKSYIESCRADYPKLADDLSDKLSLMKGSKGIAESVDNVISITSSKT